MGGSQGASGINELVLQSLPLLASRAPELQWFHLTGSGDHREADPGLRGVEAEGGRASVFRRHGSGAGRGDRSRLPRGRILAR